MPFYTPKMYNTIKDHRLCRWPYKRGFFHSPFLIYTEKFLYCDQYQSTAQNSGQDIPVFRPGDKAFGQIGDAAYREIHHGHKPRQDIASLRLEIHTVRVVKVQDKRGKSGDQHTPVEHGFSLDLPVFAEPEHLFQLHQTSQQSAQE